MASRVAKGPPPPAAAKTGVEVPEEKESNVAPVTRREFLFYVWGASIALLLGQSTGIIIWFMLPRFRAGEFGGVFEGVSVPEPGSEPIQNAAGRFWMANSEDGIVALYTVCTHLGCLYSWIPANTRFECPCHGSKFRLDGSYIEGPAPRSLDRFAMTVVTPSGEITTNETGDPITGVDVADIRDVRVDTGNRIKRDGRV